MFIRLFFAVLIFTFPLAVKGETVKIKCDSGMWHAEIQSDQDTALHVSGVGEVVWSPKTLSDGSKNVYWKNDFNEGVISLDSGLGEVTAGARLGEKFNCSIERNIVAASNKQPDNSRDAESNSSDVGFRDLTIGAPFYLVDEFCGATDSTGKRNCYGIDDLGFRISHAKIPNQYFTEKDQGYRDLVVGSSSKAVVENCNPPNASDTFYTGRCYGSVFEIYFENEFEKAEADFSTFLGEPKKIMEEDCSVTTGGFNCFGFPDLVFRIQYDPQIETYGGKGEGYKDLKIGNGASSIKSHCREASDGKFTCYDDDDTIFKFNFTTEKYSDHFRALAIYEDASLVEQLCIKQGSGSYRCYDEEDFTFFITVNDAKQFRKYKDIEAGKSFSFVDKHCLETSFGSSKYSCYGRRDLNFTIYYLEKNVRSLASVGDIKLGDDVSKVSRHCVARYDEEYGHRRNLKCYGDPEFYFSFGTSINNSKPYNEIISSISVHNKKIQEVFISRKSGAHIEEFKYDRKVLKNITVDRSTVGSLEVYEKNTKIKNMIKINDLSVITKIEIDLGPLYQTFLDRIIGDPDNPYSKLKSNLDKKYIEDWAFTERDRKLFNEGERESLWSSYNNGQVLTEIRRVDAYSDLRLFVHYHTEEEGLKLSKSRRPKNAKFSDF